MKKYEKPKSKNKQEDKEEIRSHMNINAYSKECFRNQKGRRKIIKKKWEGKQSKEVE